MSYVIIIKLECFYYRVRHYTAPSTLLADKILIVFLKEYDNNGIAVITVYVRR